MQAFQNEITAIAKQKQKAAALPPSRDLENLSVATPDSSKESVDPDAHRSLLVRYDSLQLLKAHIVCI